MTDTITPRARRRHVDRKNRQRDLTSRKHDMFSEVEQLKQDADRQAADEQIADWEKQ